MTNPAAAIRMLITYAVIIPVAIFVGYLLTNPLDFSTLGYMGLIAAVIVSPLFIKGHYPLLVFGRACPMLCFFLIGRPPLGQVVVVVSLFIAITERILNSEKRFVSAPVMTWPLLFIAAVTYLTAKLTGGIGLHSLGGDTGGGRKYLSVFIGVATFFALTSQVIPKNKRMFYIGLSILPGLLGVISDMFPFLPSPLNLINLLFPPTSSYSEGIVVGYTRLVSLSFAVGPVMIYLLARYGLGGILSARHPWRALLFVACFLLSMLGGFRNAFFGLVLLLGLMFFFEGLHRSRLLPALALAGVLGMTIMGAFSDRLPYTFQRSMAFLPLKWDPEVLVDTHGSTEWRLQMWRLLWPKVPQYLLLGKGYALSKEDFDLMGGGTFATGQTAQFDASEQGLAVSGDYHSGPLSTLMPFGIWGAIGIVWLMAATFFVVYRNYRYGEPDLRIYNVYLLASCIGSIVGFLFLFGAFSDSIGGFAGMAGMSIAMNGRLARPQPKAVASPRIKPLPAPAPLPA